MNQSRNCPHWNNSNVAMVTNDRNEQKSAVNAQGRRQENVAQTDRRHGRNSTKDLQDSMSILKKIQNQTKIKRYGYDDKRAHWHNRKISAQKNASISNITLSRNPPHWTKTGKEMFSTKCISPWSRPSPEAAVTKKVAGIRYEARSGGCSSIDSLVF